MADQNEKVLETPKAKVAPKLAGANGDAIEAYAKAQAKGRLQGLRSEVGKTELEWERKLTKEQKKALDELRKAKNSEERVKLFAQIADDIGLDPLLSLIPELGDAGSSVISGVYLLMEAKRADLGFGAYLKIIGLQAADFAVGAIPVAGDVADYFFKANKWSAKSFEEKTKELEEKARKAGVPEEKIRMLRHSAEKWPRLASRGVGLYGKYKKNGSKDAEPTQSQRQG